MEPITRDPEPGAREDDDIDRPARTRTVPPLAPCVDTPHAGDVTPRAHGPLRWVYAGLLFSLMLVALALALAPMARGTTYKWVDEKGEVHYSDKIPPDAVDKARVELNKQGMPIRKLDPAPSPEQRRAVQAEAEKKRDNTKTNETAERRDRALLQSYTDESEIDLARTRALATIETQVTSAQAYSTQLKRRRTEVDAQKAALGAKPVPPALERESENIDSELARQDALLASKQQEIVSVNTKYDADKQRWRELRSVADANAAAAAGVAPNPAAPGTPATAKPKAIAQ